MSTMSDFKRREAAMATFNEHMRYNADKPGLATHINHSSTLSLDMSGLLTDDELSDVTFIVEDERIKCHKLILATRSDYFKALLYGGLKESAENEIIIHDASPPVFRFVLRYIYTGELILYMTQEQMIDLFAISHKYCLKELENSIAENLEGFLLEKNFAIIFNTALMYGHEKLVEDCLNFADYNALDILRHESFVDLSIKAVEELAKRDSFWAPEIDIFEAVKRWVEADVERVQYAKMLMSKLRWPLITQKELLATVRPTNLLSSDALLDAINEQQSKRSSELVHRGCKNRDVNIACIQHGAKVIKGEAQGLFLSSDFIPTAIQENRVHTRHAIGDVEGIVVELGKSWIINTIRLYLPNREPEIKHYSYYVEVSMDNNDWLRIIDYSMIPCRGRQNLLFPQRAVKFIRVVGVSNSAANKHFHLTAIEALYSTDALYELADPPFEQIVEPTDNIATVEKHATVVDGVSRSRNALLNGEYHDYDWDTGYTCHQVGSGSITVQFPQPYVIDSIRLLLWDCDDRYYSYFVEVSLNQKEWTMVADRRNDQCRSWQLLKFPSVACVFVKITGVHNSANEVFHCVHFEAPASNTDHSQEDTFDFNPSRSPMRVDGEEMEGDN